MSVDVPVQAKLILSKRMKLVAIFFASSYWAGILAVPYPYQSLLLAIWILLVVSGIAFVTRRSLRRTQSILRFERDAVSLMAGREWHRLPIATAIEWRTTSSFVLQTRGMTFELSFSSEQEARESARIIRDKFPEIDVRLIRSSAN